MLEDILLHLTLHLRPYIYQVAMMVVATLLVLYGNNINNAVKRQISHYNFVVRTLIFILLCAFGYGLLLSWLTPLLADTLRRLPNMYLGVTMISIVLGLGILAERKRAL